MLLLFFNLFLLFGCTLADIGYQEEYFDQEIDHFNLVILGNKTFKQRYLYNDSWWDKEKGPIFFYAGNEGNIEGFWENTGFVFDIAKEFKPLIIFAEHRYYGKSLPFGNDSFGFPAISMLTIEQALADYATLLKSLKKTFKAENCPVIAFGGSYGGMLAAYMRFKYPNVVQGAIASSAPIYQVAGLVPGNVFFQGVTKDFRDVSQECEDRVRSAFNILQKWFALGQVGLRKISRTFRLCGTLNGEDDYDHFLRWIRNAFIYAAMVDYPYPASFMGNFPAFPVKVMCNRLVSAPTPTIGLFSATSLYYNSSGTVDCFDVWKEYLYCADPTGCGLGPDSRAWDFQACTEINLEGGTTGEKDMFPFLPFNSSMRDAYCMKTWIAKPRRNWLDIMFWGYDISSASNIVFSNGDLDPWAAGGVLKNISDSLVAVIIKGGAHHLDLRGSNPKDPDSVKEARNIEKQNIHKWIEEWNNMKLCEINKEINYEQNDELHRELSNEILLDDTTL